MNIFIWLMGLLMIGIGFLVKAAPDLIAGYNTMSDEKKANVDIRGLSTFMRNVFIGIGIAIVVCYYLFHWLGWDTLADLAPMIIIIVGVMVVMVGSRKYDHNKPSGKPLAMIITLVVLLAVVAFCFYGYLPTKTVISGNTVKFTGIYGTEFSTNDVESFELVDTIPTIKLRTNGFSLGSINKGTFKLDEYGTTRLFMHSQKPPYILLTKKSGERVIINFPTPIQTKTVYNNVTMVLEKGAVENDIIIDNK